MPATDQLRIALADRYSIEREIGAGGMATVYLARDLKHDREVAPDSRGDAFMSKMVRPAN